MNKHNYLIHYIICSLITLMAACTTEDFSPTPTHQLSIALDFPAETDGQKEGIRVELKSIGTEGLFVDSTDQQGVAHFMVPAGIYEATASTTQKQGHNALMILNGTSGQIVMKSYDLTADILLHGSSISQVVIKEVYNGGVKKDDGNSFHYDKCFILYNNSESSVTFANLCVGIAAPYNSQANNYWYGTDGKLIYEHADYIPGIDGIWYFPDALTIAPYSQVVVNVHGAIDNTITYPQSVNYAHSDYYCMYHPEAGYTNNSYYPTPADVIPASHYLRAVKIGISNAWALSTTSPALFLFQTEGLSPLSYASDTNYFMYTPGAAQTDINKVIKVPTDWVLDGVEIFSAAHIASNLKRLTPTVDAGYVMLTNQHGHSLYRNVDQAATEALAENEGKLVYGYTADPSGIDAEASLKNGAHIIYMDTNNSSNDFHQREQCSLRSMQ